MNSKSALNGVVYCVVIIILLQFFVSYVLSFIATARADDTTNILGSFDPYIELIRSLADIGTYVFAGFGCILFLMFLSKHSEESKEKKMLAQKNAP